MKTLVRSIHESEAAIEKGMKWTIAVSLVLTWLIVFLIPTGFVYAQSLPVLPGIKPSSGLVERVISEGNKVDASENLKMERASGSLEFVNKIVTEKRVEGPLQKSLTDSRSQILPSELSPSTKEVVKTKIADSTGVPHKLEVLSEALISQHIKGLAALKKDEFTCSYLSAIGVDLNAWLNAHSKEKYFADIFKIQGPWVIMLLAMSPTSMHEYVQDLDLPSTVGDILEANKLPSNLTVEQEGRDVVVEAQGSNNLWITFRVNEKDEVSVVVE